MKHLIVDLDSNIKLLLLHNDTIIDIRELVCSVNVLDKLFAIMDVLNVDKVTFITHNTMSACLYSDCCVAYGMETVEGFLLSSINTQDVNSLLNLCKSAGVLDVHFVDKAGYYAALGQKGVCYVEKYLGMYHLLCVDEGKIKGYAVCTEQSYEQRLNKFKENNQLTEVVFEEELTDTDNLMLFTNSAMVLEDEELVHDLSIFAFACMEEGSYHYGADILERSTEIIRNCKLKEVHTGDMYDEHVPASVNEMNVPIVKEDVAADDDVDAEESLDDAVEMDSLEDIAAQPKPLLMRKSDKINDGMSMSRVAMRMNTSNLVASLTLVFGVLGVLVTLMSFIVLKNTQDKIAEIEKELEYNQTVLASIHTEVNTYEMCINATPNTAIELYKNIEGSISACNGELHMMHYDKESSFINVLISNKDDVEQFISACSELGYHAVCDSLTESENSTDSEENVGETGYMVVITGV